MKNMASTTPTFIYNGRFATQKTTGVQRVARELIAALGNWFGWFEPEASPLRSLGQAFIDVTPGWLANWAKETLGKADKPALGAGMALTLLLAGAAVGLAQQGDEQPGDPVAAIRAGMDTVEAVLDSGRAAEQLQRWVSATRTEGQGA